MKFSPTSPPLLVAGVAFIVADWLRRYGLLRSVAASIGGLGVMATVVVALAMVPFCAEGWAHVGALETLVMNRADGAAVRAVKGEPNLVVTPGGRTYRGTDLTALWPMSENSKRRINAKLRSHPETWVYWNWMVDFVFFDETGRVVEFESINN